MAPQAPTLRAPFILLLIVAWAFTPRLRAFLVLGFVGRIAFVRCYHPTCRFVEFWIAALSPFQRIIDTQGGPAVSLVPFQVKVDVVPFMTLLQVAHDAAVWMGSLTLLQARPPDVPVGHPIGVQVNVGSGMAIGQVAESKERAHSDGIAQPFRCLP